MLFGMILLYRLVHGAEPPCAHIISRSCILPSRTHSVHWPWLVCCT
jgi:hypothetical protein